MESLMLDFPWTNYQGLACDVLEKVDAASDDQDATGEMTDDVIAALKGAGYFKLPIPKAFGGMDRTLVDCCLVQKQLGRYDAGLAIGLNMHLFTVGLIAEHWQRTKDISGILLESIARSDLIVASAFAEPGLGGNILRSNLDARRAGDTYSLSGVKTPCSLARRCDLICLQARDVETDELIIGLLPAASHGVSVRRNSKLLGMCSSESDTLVLEDAKLPQAMLFHRCKLGEDSSDIFHCSLIWFALTAVSAYLGLLDQALDETRKVLGGTKLPNGTTRAYSSSHQQRYGEVLCKKLALESACFGLASSIARPCGIDASAMPLALSIKEHAARIIPRMIGDLMEICGSSCYSKDHPFSRLLRDCQAITFHPPVPDATTQLLGQAVLTDDWRWR